MRRLSLLFLLAAALLPAQCSLKFALKASGRSAVLDNRKTPCSNWTIEYTIAGTSASIDLQGSSNIQGPWSSLSGFPLSSPASGTVLITSSSPYLSVVRTSPGAGLISGTLRGSVTGGSASMATTRPPGTNDVTVATTAFVAAALAVTTAGCTNDGSGNMTCASFTSAAGGPSELVNQAAPAGNAPNGKLFTWGDATNKVLTVRDENGAVSKTTKSIACTVGSHIVSANDDGTFTCSIDTAAVPSSINLSTVSLIDYFMPRTAATTATGTIPWANTGTSQIYMSQPVVNGYTPGARLTTKSGTPASGDVAGLSILYNSIGVLNTIGSSGLHGTWDMQARVWIDVPAGVGSLANVGFYMGWGRNGVGLATNDGVEIVASSTAPAAACLSGGTWNAAHWMLFQQNGGTSGICTDTGIPVQSATKYTLRLYSPSPGTVQWSINGSALASLTGIIATATNMVPGFGVATQTAAQKSMDINAFALTITGLQ